MPNPRAQKNPTFIPQALQGLADMGRGAVRGALAEGLGTAGDLTQALSNIKTAGFMPAMLARGLQGPTSEEMSHALRGMTPNPLTQPDRAHTAQMGQTFGSVPASMAGGAGTNAALQKMAGRLNNMQKVESMMPKAPKPVAEVLKGPEPDFMRVYSGQRVPIEGKFDIMRADPHASMGRAFYTAELPRYANKFTGNQPGANVTPVDVDRNRMLMFDKMYDTPQGQMEGLDYYDMLRRQAMVKSGIGKDMIRQEILDAGFAGTQMPNATGKAYAIYDPSVAQDMSGRGFARGGLVDGSSNDDGTGGENWRNTPGMAAGGVPYRGINPIATGLGQMRQQSVARDAASSLMAKNRAAQFANQDALRLQRQNQLAAAKTARLNALAPKLSTYVPPAGSTTTSPTVTSPAVTDPATTTVDSTTPIVPAAKPDDPGNYQGGARGGLVSMADGGIVRMSKGGKFGAPIEAAAKTFKALPGQSFQGKTGLSVLSPDEEARRLIAKMDQPSIEDVLKTVEEPKPVTAAQRAAAGRAAAKQIAATQVQKLSDVLGNLNIEGKGSLGVGQSDRTRVGGGNIGGANFPGIQHADPLYEGMGWGVGNVPTASNLISNFDSPGKYFTTLLGSEHQLKTNPVVFERLKKGFLQAMKEGKLGPELEAKINHNLALTFGEGADIRDPQIWKKANTFEKRAALGDIMLGRGIPPKKGGVALGGEKSGKGVIFNPSDILREETEKMLLHPEHGGNVPTFAVGPRLVQFSGDYSVRPDLHPGFPVLLHGKDMNVVFSPVPGEIALPDFVAELAKPSEKFPKGKKPGYYEWTMGLPGKGLPSQPITEEYLRHLQREGFKKGGKVKKMQAGGKAIVSGLQAIAKPAKQTITSAIDPTMDIASRLSQPDRINLLPMPSRWFLDPKNNPNVQKLVEKVLEVNNMKRSDFYSGAFVNPRTGEVMDKKVMQDVGVLINPNTGRPMMSAEKETDLTIGDRKKGSITKSNLVRKQLYETEGDPILKDLDFLVAIEQSGMGHKYGLATEYATPAEMFNTMTGDNPTLRPKSQGDVFGIGDIVGRMSMKSSKMPHDVYESLLIAPKGSDVQGVKLSKKNGGIVKGRK